MGIDAPRNYYLQYPVTYRTDRKIRKLESKVGKLAPWVYLELNGLAASLPDFVISYDTSEETFEDQAAFDIAFEGEEELVSNVLKFALKNGMIEEVEAGSAYRFPWAEQQTRSRSDEAERKAGYRARKKARGTNVGQMSGTDGTNVGQMSGTDSELSQSQKDKCLDSKNKNKSKSKEIEAELEEEKEKEPIDRHRSRSNGDAAPTGMDLLVDIPLPNGKSWRPDADEYERMRESYPSLDIVTEFNLMRAWCQRGEGGCYSGASVSGFAWRWLERESQSRARQEVTEERKRKGSRSSADIWEDLARRVDNGEFG